MNIVGVILARGGSKRVPRKNLKPLCGKPLIAHTIETAHKSKYINKVVLSTEDFEIKQVARAFGADVIDRPYELAQDETKSAPCVVHAVDELKAQGYDPDIIILLQPTTPTKTAQMIDNVVEKLITSDFDSVFTGHKVSYTMALWKKCHNGKTIGLYDYHLRPRWQDVHLNEEIWGENGAIYAIKADAFHKFKDFIGENPYILETPYIIDIDTEEDFKKAEEVMMGEIHSVEIDVEI
ncbi:MAG: acylneuraminate cytidylyltransferase family protein [Candidatus Gastranaerophilales bacterium]|nr:acylneuraminate cytidylyltransferase family protein [Candidatus Gastranaerophilales bacterium]